MHELTGPKGPAFDEIDWGRPDFEILVSHFHRGVAAISLDEYDAFRRWLDAFGYRVDTFDMSAGLNVAVPAIGRYFRWEEQFGYVLGPDRRNLDALDDGFEMEVPENGLVLEIVDAEVAWKEDPRWFLGLISIASAHSMRHLALGRRFFTVLPLPKSSPLINAAVEQFTIARTFVPKSILNRY